MLVRVQVTHKVLLIDHSWECVQLSLLLHQGLVVYDKFTTAGNV